jgi:hypothetical protein
MDEYFYFGLSWFVKMGYGVDCSSGYFIWSIGLFDGSCVRVRSFDGNNLIYSVLFRKSKYLII